MPRKRRFFLPGVPAHIVQRGRSRQPVFFADDDYQAYLHWLAEAGERYKCAIHAYVLMTNHVHILATPRESGGLSQMMQYLGRRYVPYINRRYGMSGSIWEGRYKASLVDDQTKGSEPFKLQSEKRKGSEPFKLQGEVYARWFLPRPGNLLVTSRLLLLRVMMAEPCPSRLCCLSISWHKLYIWPKAS